jgi:hypothetical protein
MRECNICFEPFTTLDVRLQTELRGICYDCSEELSFHGMTLEEVTRVVRVSRAIKDDQNATSIQRRHTKDMES